MKTVESIYALIDSQPPEIPVFHEIALRLQQMMSTNSYRIEEVIKLINEDTALAATMLKQANSTYNIGKAAITTIKEAIVRLGSQQIVNLAFSASMSNSRSRNNFINDSMKQVWQHSYRVAIISSWLAVELNQEKLIRKINADEVYLAGLLHDIGKLYLLKALDSLAQQGKIQVSGSLPGDLSTAYAAETGAKVLRHWNIPSIYIDVVERHCASNWHTGVNDHMVAAVRLSCRLCDYMEDAYVLTEESTVFSQVSYELETLKISNVEYLCSIVHAVTE